MTTAAVMQPTYLPWLGYFDLMDQVDTFVLLDTVPFAYQSWQHRNRLPAVDEPTWVTVPITKASRRSTIDAVEVSTGGWFPERHLNVLRDRYRSAPVPELVDEVIGLLAEHAEGRLVDLTVPLIDFLARHLGIETPRVLASELAGAGRRSELVASLLGAVGADRYVSPPGSLDYLADDEATFTDRGIDVMVHRYEHPVYDQGMGPFQSHCSALDLVLRQPTAAGDVLRSGRRPPVPLEQALLAVGCP